MRRWTRIQELCAKTQHALLARTVGWQKPSAVEEVTACSFDSMVL